MKTQKNSLLLLSFLLCIIAAGCGSPTPSTGPDTIRGDPTGFRGVSVNDEGPRTSIPASDAGNTSPSDASLDTVEKPQRDARKVGPSDTPAPGDGRATNDALWLPDDGPLVDADPGTEDGDTAAHHPPDTVPTDGGGEGEPDASVEDDAGTPPPTECVDIPAPESPEEDLLPSNVPLGATETVSNGGFADDFLYNSLGNIRIGTRREWGASVVFFGLVAGAPSTNVIDANDTGREVQIALYDPDRIHQGCAWNASCQSGGSPCPASISYLGWNPVQGGNQCNNGSGVLDVVLAPGEMESTVVPLHWNPDWESPTCDKIGCGDPVLQTLPSDVVYQQRLRFVSPHVVEMDMTIINSTSTAHAATNQEFPTVYASWGNVGPNLNVLLDSNGDAVAIDQPANDGFFSKTFTSPGAFVALQNASLDYGVGMYYENHLTDFQGWQKAGVFNNFRSLFPFGIPASGTVRARAYLIIGSFATISAEVSGLVSSLPAFGSLESPLADWIRFTSN